MAERLIGKDIVPPDLIAKVTGRAKYAEDFRAEGMVFAKLLLSPMPHARVRRIDASRALRMEGVLGILTADDVPTANAPVERALTNEPLYEGEPILALAAVDETTAAEAIERIKIDLEPLPFVIDPLHSLRPGGPTARSEGNTLVTRREMRDGKEETVREVKDVKWTAADFAVPKGKLPMGKPMSEWAVGDIEAGFKQADLVLDETLVHQSLSHHPLESRSMMAYWQNGRLIFHGSTQSVARARAALATLLKLEQKDVVVVCEYCGGGFGSKIGITPQWAIPALLSKKIGRPVMLRVSRYEENYIGRARPGFQASVKLGFRKDGRVTAIDLYIVQDNGSYGGGQGDMASAAETASLAYQPLNMRFRGAWVYTNTPPRAAQRQPGGAQIVAMLEPLLDKAARQLGVDRLELRRINAPGHDAWVGERKEKVTSAFVREAIDLGAKAFGWEEKKRLSGQRRGTKVTGVGVALSPYHGGSTGFDGLLVIRPDGKLYIHQGIGNLGTHSFADTARVAAEQLGMAWKDCQVIWGDTSRHLPWSSSQSGSQTTHAHTRANHAVALEAKKKIQEIAARDLGGSPRDYVVDGGRVFRRGGGSGMSFAQVAKRAIQLGGKYDGHELAENLNAMTKASATALAGSGLVAAAKDTYEHEGGTWSFVVGFSVIELDIETGVVDLKEYLASADCGTVMHPRSLAAQLHGGGVQGFGTARSQKWVFDPRWGAGFAKRFYTARPPGMLDVPPKMDWVAVNKPDPQTPVGAKGIGEPPIGAGEAVMASAIADALGGKCLCRTPLTTDVILAAIEGRQQPYAPLDTHV